MTKPLEWSGAVPFVTMAQNVAGIDGMPWGDEFLAWYKPAEWLGEHRACAVFLGMKLLAERARRVDGPECGCARCDIAQNGRPTRMSVCPQCGDKRCPRAEDHRNECRETPNAQAHRPAPAR